MGMNLGRFGGYYPNFNLRQPIQGGNKPIQIGNVENKSKATTFGNHEYTSVEDLINDLNDGKFKKGDKVVLKREQYTETYEVLGNGRLKRC